MDWIEFWEKVIGHLAWLVVGLIIFLTVRKHIGTLAERILELSFGGATFKFGKLLSKGAEIIEDSPVAPAELPEPQTQLPLPPPEGAAGVHQPDVAVPTQVSELDEPYEDGVPGIFEVFEEVEKSLEQIGGALGIKTRSGPTIVRMMLKRDLVTPDVVELYNTLRTGRNAIAHGQAKLPNEAESLEFIRQAEFLNASLIRAMSQLQINKKAP
jgi:hypothetical protein